MAWEHKKVANGSSALTREGISEAPSTAPATPIVLPNPPADGIAIHVDDGHRVSAAASSTRWPSRPDAAEAGTPMAIAVDEFALTAGGVAQAAEASRSISRSEPEVTSCRTAIDSWENRSRSAPAR